MPVGGFFASGGYTGSTGGSRSPGGGGAAVGTTAGNSWSMPSWTQPVLAPASAPSPLQSSSRPMQLAGQVSGSPLPMNGIGNANPTNYPGLADTYLRGQEYGRAQDTAITYYGPQQKMINQSQAINKARLGLVGVNAEYQQMAARRDAGLAQRKLELERGLVNGQLGNVEKLRALAKEQLANQKADLANSRAKTIDQSKRSQWDLESDLTKRGAFNTVANERGTGRISRDLLYNLQSLNVQEQGADIGYRQGMVGYDNQSFALRNRIAGIGLDAEGVANSLENALQQSGMSQFTDIFSLIEARNGLSSQEAVVADQILQMVGAMTGLPSSILEQIFGPVGGGSGSGSGTSGSTNRRQGAGAPL